MASSCWGWPAGACCAEEEEKEEEEQELGNALQEAVQWEQESHRRGRAGAALQAAFSCQARKANALPCCPRPVTAHSSEAQPAPKFALLCLCVCSLDGNPWQPLPSGARVLLGAGGGGPLLCSKGRFQVCMTWLALKSLQCTSRPVKLAA